MHEDTSAVSAWCFCNCSEGEDIMNLVPRNEPEAFLCQYADHIHSGTVGCTRRTLLGGLAALGAGALFTAAIPEPPFLESIKMPAAVETSILPEPSFDAEIPISKPLVGLLPPSVIDPASSFTVTLPIP